MKLEKQCCSLQQAKRLKELGIIQFNNAHLYWLDYSDNPHGPKLVIDEALLCGWDGWDMTYAAFTVAELGVMLPTETYTIRNTERENGWEWQDDGNGKAWLGFPNEAAARADLLIMLLENNKTTYAEVNTRLLAQ